MTTTSVEDTVKDRLRKFHEDWIAMSLANGETFDQVFDEYFSDRAVAIRASGNPLPREMWKTMISSDDVVYNQPEKHKLVSIDSCEVYAGDMAAVTTFTMDVFFTYKGTQNEDRAKVSLAWGKEDDVWKIMLFHRATGQEVPKEE